MAAVGMVLGFGVALALDRRLRARRERRRALDEGRRARADAEASDDVLAERVRAALEPPPGVEVAAVEGAVVLFGRVPRHLVARLRERAAAVEGVTDVEDRLTPVDDGAGDAHRA